MPNHGSRRRSLPQRLLLVAEAGALLVVAKTLTRTLPFRVLAGQLEKQRAPSPHFEPAVSRSELSAVSWSLGAIGRRIPVLNQCLLQGIAARWMLNRRRIPNTLFFGVSKDPGGPLLAHAWVRAADHTIVGEAERSSYTVIATFGLCEKKEECHGTS